MKLNTRKEPTDMGTEWMRKYSWEELIELPRQAQDQGGDLRLEEDGFRYWTQRGDPLSRQITIEHYNGRKWEVVDQYEDEENQ